MKNQLFLFIILIPFLSQAEILEGIAKNQKGEVVYSEKHNIEIDEAGLNKFIRVEYFKPDGSQFATMTSDFSKSKTIPETVFEDSRFKRKLILRLSDASVEFEEAKEGKTISKNKIPFHSSMAASQGFDNFIRINFSKLQNEIVEFKFGVLENKDFYSLKGYKISNIKDDIEFGIKSSSWLINIFATELKVVYDSKTKKLKSFSGRSNISDDSGKSQDVVIEYQWKSRI